MDSNLVDITAGLFSLLCTVVFLLFWKPKKIWRFEDEGGHIMVTPAGKSVPRFPAVPDQRFTPILLGKHSKHGCRS